MNTTTTFARQASDTRNADLNTIATMLQTQQARKVDVVAPASAIKASDGRLVITGAAPVIDTDGVTDPNGIYTPTTVCDEGLASKLDVPVGYLKRLRAGRVDLWDTNVNGWLHGAKARGSVASGEFQIIRPAVEADPRSFLVRCFRGEDGTPGVARAFLSDRYNIVDNLDVLMATLSGIRDAGVDVQVRSADLTDRRMVVKVSCPEVTAMAPELLAGYRSPFTGQTGEDNPVVWAGFQITNSETGGGAFTITPRLEVQVCTNGMVMGKDSLNRVHLGARMDAGVVRWAADTQQKALDLIITQTRDAVNTFLSPEYLNRTIAGLSAKAGEPVEDHEQVRVLAKSLKFTDADVDGILSHFTRGGQLTRGGVVHAITSYAQTVEDGDTAYELEAKATTLLGV